MAPGAMSQSRTEYLDLTSSFNAGARSFYRSLGFSELVSLPDLISSGSDEILLRKTLE